MNKPGPQVPFDEEKLELVREFLRREFRGCQHRDYFAVDGTAAQVFVIEATPRLRHTLVIPKATFEDEDFGLLLDAHLLTTLKLAGEAPVTMTSRGSWY